MSRTKRFHAEESLKQWINKVSASGAGQSAFARFEERGGKLVMTFETARVRDLELMLTLLSAAYGTGCDDTRKHIAELRKAVAS